MAEPLTDRLLTITQVRKFVPLARSTIYSRVAEGSFPRPRKDGKRSFWRMSDVQAWIARDEAA